MRKIAVALVAALSGAVALPGAGAAPLSRPAPVVIDEQLSCPNGDLAPAPDSFDPARRKAAPVDLEVLVFSDPSVAAEVRHAFERAGGAFRPHGIRLRPTFRSAPVPDMDGDDAAYMDWLKQQVGGSRPDGFDVVYLALHRYVGVGGRADCIGGVAYDTRAFAIGMLTMDGLVGVNIEGFPLPGLPVPDAAAKIAAHEIGHLLGAHHHFGQCGLGFPTADATHPCDVMFSMFMQQMGLFFGPVTGPVIRRYAQLYARR